MEKEQLEKEVLNEVERIDWLSIGSQFDAIEDILKLVINDKSTHHKDALRKVFATVVEIRERNYYELDKMSEIGSKYSSLIEQERLEGINYVTGVDKAL